MFEEDDEFELLSGSSENIRRVCIARLYENLSSVRDLKELLGHSQVVRFRKIVQEKSRSDPGFIAKLKKECRDMWPDETPASSEIAVGPGIKALEDPPESPLLAKAYDYLQSGFLSETTALQIACLIKAEAQDSPEVKTSDVTTLLRAFNYKIPNPAALIRSLADRAEPVIEIHEEKIGPRQELQFRLLPEAEAGLKKSLLGKAAINVA